MAKRFQTLMIKYLFTVCLITIDIGAAMVYFSLADFKRGIYWIAAGVLKDQFDFKIRLS